MSSAIQSDTEAKEAAKEAAAAAVEKRRIFWTIVGIAISVLALVGTGINAGSAYLNFNLNSDTQTRSLSLALDTQRIALDTQKLALFTQFQQQYAAVAARFPAALKDPTFKPKFGTDDYSRLEAYWLFCFSEWYATNRLVPVVDGDLWKSYYAPLITNALEIPSLRYALENMIERYPLNRGDYRPFFLEMAALSSSARAPFKDDTQRRLNAPR